MAWWSLDRPSTTEADYSNPDDCHFAHLINQTVNESGSELTWQPRNSASGVPSVGGAVTHGEGRAK